MQGDARKAKKRRLELRRRKEEGPELRTSPPCSPGQKMNPAARKQAGLGYSGRGLCGLGAGWDRPPRLGIAALALPERPPDRKTAQTHRFRMPGGVKYACRRAASVAIRMGTCPAFIECTYVTYVRRCARISCMHVHGISTIAEKAIELSLSVHTWSPKLVDIASSLFHMRALRIA